MQLAHDYFHKYLSDNIADADTLERMKHVIAEFTARAPRIIVTKCIDGRVHGSKAKGYPPTSIQFGRTDGNRGSLDKSNFWFWNRIDRVVKDAHFNTPEMPALFIAYMHRSDCGFGCSAHKSDDEAALKAIELQMEEVRKTYKDSELYVMGGITNTDNMAETLFFFEGYRLDTAKIIQYCNLKNPEDVFHESFLTHAFNDIATARYVNHKNPGELLSGIHPQFFSDLQVCLSMQSYLLNEITSMIRKDKSDLKRLIRPDIIDYIFLTLDKVKIPSTLLPPILYQSVWNMIYALYQINLLNHLNPEELARHLDHAEELVCYGEGFETLTRNKAVLVKAGRGDDMDALKVAKVVLENNRKKYIQDHKLLVHVNVEINGELVQWHDFNDNVGSRIKTMLRNVDIVYGDEVGILTTYSYRDQKRFYPVKIESGDLRMVYPADVISEINSSLKFSNIALKAQEALYKEAFIKRGIEK
jgi:hypothetical protein